jgi:hypothetical protein
LALSAASGPRAASAQERSAGDIAQARELFNQGTELRTKGDNVGALEKLKAAHALADTPITGAELGKTFELVGQLVEAQEAFLSVARLPVRPEETPRSAAARRESALLVEQLRSRIPTVTVRITGVTTDSVAVTIDGALVVKEALAGPRLINPGRHHILAKSTSGGTAETTVDVKEGEARDVELKIAFAGGDGAAGGSAPALPPRDAPAIRPPAESEPAPRSHLLEWSLLGGGAAVGAAGVVVMIVETRQTDDANAKHDKAAYDAAITGWRVGLAGAVVGAAAVVGGGILFVLSSRGDGAHASRGSVWLAGEANGLRIGGTW